MGSKSGITYQGVHKALLELLEDKVIAKNKFEYFIAPNWVKIFSDDMSILQEQYTTKKLLNFDKQSQVLNFKTIDEVIDFFLASINSKFYGESTDLVLLANRMYILPLGIRHKHLMQKFLAKNKAYILARGNTLIDKLVKSYLHSLNVEAYTGVNIRFPLSLFVYGDCVVYIHTLFSKHDMGIFEKLFRQNIKEIREDMLSTFEKVMHRNICTKIVIIRDKEIVDIIRLVIHDIMEENRIHVS
ncbi:MAG: hypothetical protein ABIJ34_06160 [archaeon]